MADWCGWVLSNAAAAHVAEGDSAAQLAALLNAVHKVRPAGCYAAAVRAPRGGASWLCGEWPGHVASRPSQQASARWEQSRLGGLEQTPMMHIPPAWQGTSHPSS